MAHAKTIAPNRSSNLELSPEMYVPQFAPGEVFRTETFNPDFDPRIYAAAAEAGKIVVSAAFKDFVTGAKGVEIFTDKQIDGRRSAHGVRFGSMGGKADLGIRVALKPFSDPSDAVNELSGYERLLELNIPTFSPIGIFPALHGDHFISVSAKNNNLQSLDRAPWVVGRAADSEKSMMLAEENDRQVKGISDTLAYIHANGIFHPDGQVKNFAANASGRVGVIDTEGMVVRELGDEDSSELAWNDINKLVKSLVVEASRDDDEDKIFGVGMFARMPLNLVRAGINDLILEPYIDRLEQISKSAGGRQQRQIDLLSDGIIKHFYEDERWPQHFIDMNRRSFR